MKVGINGMGRIGRLALRAAMGAAERQSDDPRAGNRLEVVHLNELKGGAAATAHLLPNNFRFHPMQQQQKFHGARWAWTWCWNAPANF
jgi:glyceraldehyde-3-phosphate dehydrogenase/erythrose-4-phosphate dehydrogenase